MGVWLHSGTQPGTLMVLPTFYFMIKKVKLLSTQEYSGAGVVRGHWTELNSNVQSNVFTPTEAKTPMNIFKKVESQAW